jgi:hypothetical protein
VRKNCSSRTSNKRREQVWSGAAPDRSHPAPAITGLALRTPRSSRGVLRSSKSSGPTTRRREADNADRPASAVRPKPSSAKSWLHSRIPVAAQRKAVPEGTAFQLDRKKMEMGLNSGEIALASALPGEPANDPSKRSTYVPVKTTEKASSSLFLESIVHFHSTEKIRRLLARPPELLYRK